ncbi:MAG: hypothetical protein DMF75_19580, partial [Acidobacteria bacterium]
MRRTSRAAGRKSPKRKPARAKPTPHSFISFLSADAQLIAIVSLVIIVFLCYANSLGNEFVFDDYLLVLGNNRIRSINAALFWNSYRPIRDISYAIDYALWGERAFGFHLTNLVIHAANVLLVFALIRRFTESLVTAALATLIFAVHPIQTDAVTYISGRRDLLFTFFYLLAFHSYLTYYRRRWSPQAVVYFVLFFLLWALSLLSKEMAASLPILIFVWHYCDAWEEEGESWWRQAAHTARKAFQREKWLYVSLWLIGIAFTLYWVFIKGASQRVTAGKINYWGGSFYTNFLTVMRVHAWYLKQLVNPTPIAQYLGSLEISRSIFDWRVLLSMAVVGGALCGGFLLLKRDKLMAFAVLSYFVILLPVSQIIPHHELLADHYLYLPMMSFGLFVALLARRISQSGVIDKRAPYFVAAAAVIILGAMTVIQNRTWKDERTLWTANYQAVPNSPRAALNLGNTYQETEPERAKQLFKRALELDPTPDIKEKLYDRLAVILIDEKK